MFSPLHSVTNEEHYEKCCNHFSQYRKYGRFPLKCREATTCMLASYCESIRCAVSKKKWDTKEDKSKSMVCTLYIRQCAKRHLATMLNNEKIKPVALSIVELCLAGGIRQSAVN